MVLLSDTPLTGPLGAPGWRGVSRVSPGQPGGAEVGGSRVDPAAPEESTCARPAPNQAGVRPTGCHRTPRVHLSARGFHGVEIRCLDTAPGTLSQPGPPPVPGAGGGRPMAIGQKLETGEVPSCSCSLEASRSGAAGRTHRWPRQRTKTPRLLSLLDRLSDRSRSAPPGSTCGARPRARRRQHAREATRASTGAMTWARALAGRPRARRARART